MTKVPAKLQGILWSKQVESIDLEQDKTYVIHQVLRYGTLDDIKWLMETYGEHVVKEEFLRRPQSIYSKPTLNFVKNVLLDLEKERVDESKYIQSFY